LKPGPREDAVDTSAVDLPSDVRPVLERLAANVHAMWVAGRRAEGWTWGPERDDEKLTHPNLVPYAELTESEKAYDRETAAETVRALVALGYTIKRQG
jgi:adenylate cyclase